MYSPESARENIKRFKNKKVVLVGGSFDILHVGHVRFLSQAKKWGDILVVGINSNSVVRNKKGSRRPIIDERQRAEVLLNLKSVDFVFIARQDFLGNILGVIKPNILVFTVERGRLKSAKERASLVRKQHPNIKIVFLPKEGKKISTTRIKRKILN